MDDAGSGGEFVVCSWDIGLRRPARRRASRPALLRVLRGLAPDVLVAQEAPDGWRWRSAAAALARESGLLHLAGGRTSGGAMIDVRMRVDTVETWTKRWPASRAAPAGGLVAAVLRCGGRVFGVVGGHYPGTEQGRLHYGAAVLAAVDELRGRTPDVVVGVNLVEDAGGSAWRQLAGGGLVDSAAAGSPPGGARPSAAGSAPTFPAAGPRRRVDAIWTTPSILVVATGLPALRGGPPWLADLSGAAAHLPCVARLRLAVP